MARRRDALRAGAAPARPRAEAAYKYGYNPGQPRVPAGDPAGGQWTDANGNALTPSRIRLAGEVPTNDPPEIPKERPRKSKERTTILRLIARRMLETGETVAAFAKLGAWFITYSPTIESYNDPPKTLEELRQDLSPKAGYDIHHIVQRNQESIFGRELINSPENLVRIPRMKHWDINQWYETENREFGGVSPRAYLDGRNWDVQRSVGFEALKKFGVLKR